jgi:hypothetical protein
MATSRIYREIFKIILGEANKIDPVSISAITKRVSDNSFVETLIVYRQDVGVYYVDINSALYSFEFYEVVWNVVYEEGAPSRDLKTSFRFNPLVVASEISIDISPSRY